MNKLHLRIFTTLFAVLLPAIVSFGAPSHKPLRPLQISITPVQQGLAPSDIRPGDVVEFAVRARSAIDTNSLTIKVDLTGGAKLVSGDLTWTGPAAKNEEKSISVTVQAPENGQGRIKALVTIPPKEGARFSAVAQYVLGSEVKSKSKQEQPVKKDREGRDVIEYH